MKNAFTLLELVVVISIIVIMSVIGISNYRSAKENLTIGLETDKLVSLLQSAREETRTTPRCVEIHFEKNSPPQKRTGVYKNPVEGCHFGDTEYVRADTADGVITLDTLSVVFVPPNGSILLKEGGLRLGLAAAKIQISSSKNPSLIRTIYINPATGEISSQS